MLRELQMPHVNFFSLFFALLNIPSHHIYFYFFHEYIFRKTQSYRCFCHSEYTCMCVYIFVFCYFILFFTVIINIQFRLFSYFVSISLSRLFQVVLFSFLLLLSLLNRILRIKNYFHCCCRL